MKTPVLVTVVMVLVSLKCPGATNTQSSGVTHEDLYRPLVGSTVTNPCKWCLRHSCGPATKGPADGISLRQWAGEIGWHSLLEASADIDGDGSNELLVRPEAAARVWPVFVFRKTPEAAWTFAGTFDLSGMLQPGAPGSPTPPAILVYEACGGHFGYVKRLKLTTGGFVTDGKIEEVWLGDGYEEGTKRLAALFPVNSVMKWRDEREDSQQSAAPLTQAPRTSHSEGSR